MLWEDFKRSGAGSGGGSNQNALYMSTKFSKNDFKEKRNSIAK